MTDQQIVEKIGLADADEALKTATVQRVRAIVETRVMAMLADLLDEDKVDQLNNMEQAGVPAEEMFAWIGAQSVNVNELYEAALDDYINEFNERNTRLGLV